MNIPSTNECFRLIREMEMMDHIIDHSIMVSNVASFLALLLKKHAPHLNKELCMSAGLLHDITKTRSFKTKEIHSETGGIMLTSLGYPEVGDIVRQHVMLDAYETDTPITEKEIVNYSDKRILNDQIVSLNKRMAYIKERYCIKKRFADLFEIMKINTLKLEKKIFRPLDIEPKDLSSHMIIEIKKEDWSE